MKAFFLFAKKQAEKRNLLPHPIVSSTEGGTRMNSDRMQKPDELEAMLTAVYTAETAPESFETAWRAAVRREERWMMEKKQRNKKGFKRFWQIAVPAFCTLVLVIGTLSVADFARVATVPKEMGGETAKYDTYVYSDDGPSAVMLTTGEKSVASVERGVYDMTLEETADREISFGASNGQVVSGSVAAVSETEQERKLVRSVELTVKTTAFEEDYAAITALMQRVGGYVEYQSRSGDGSTGNKRKAYLTLRVPSAQLDAFLNGAAEIGRVTQMTQSTVDRTATYYDNETRLKTLRAKLERLNQLMKEAGDLSDLIELESAISDTQYEIDSYETAQRLIQKQVDYSEVRLDLREETVREKTEVRQYTLGERLGAALRSGWEGFVNFLSNMLVFLTITLPFWLLAAAALAVGLVLRRRVKAKKAHTREAEEK